MGVYCILTSSHFSRFKLIYSSNSNVSEGEGEIFAEMEMEKKELGAIAGAEFQTEVHFFAPLSLMRWLNAAALSLFLFPLLFKSYGAGLVVSAVAAAFPQFGNAGLCNQLARVA